MLQPTPRRDRQGLYGADVSHLEGAWEAGTCMRLLGHGRCSSSWQQKAADCSQTSHLVVERQLGSIQLTA